jgi:hypothetical protein
MNSPALLAAALLLPLLLNACSGKRFYAQVDGNGKITGQPCVEWKKPDRFVYVRSKNPGFSFKRPNGETIRPGSIETDGGSIPRVLWSQKNFSPWTYAPAYLVHDWLYEAHRRKVPAGTDAAGNAVYYTKEQADWIMAEVIKTQMEQPQFETRKSPSQLRRIYWAVSKFGKTAWNGEAHLVEDETIPSMITDTLQNLPLLPAIDSLKNELTPVPEKPAMQGTRTYQE